MKPVNYLIQALRLCSRFLFPLPEPFFFAFPCAWVVRTRRPNLPTCSCGVPGGTPEARLGGGPQHPDRHSFGDSRCRVDTATREGARRAAARTRCFDKHDLGLSDPGTFRVALAPC